MDNSLFSIVLSEIGIVLMLSKPDSLQSGFGQAVKSKK